MMATPIDVSVEKLVKKIEESQYGYSSTLQGPFGSKRVVYTDYTASGKPLTFIEEYLQSDVLPYYGNTHTTTSLTSRQTTFYREEARLEGESLGRFDHVRTLVTCSASMGTSILGTVLPAGHSINSSLIDRKFKLIVRNAVNASEKDCVIFGGSGTTGAVHKLIHCLELSSRPRPPVVFVSPFEHHSNLLPWREIGAEVVWIKQDERGRADITDLENKLRHYQASGDGRLMIGALSAASNITGVLTNTNAFSALLHKYKALAFWDYATAAPYARIDMNPVIITEEKDLVYKDAVYFSPHKFVGGVDSPGILVAKKALLKNHTPHSCGGGTVFFVTPTDHRYFKQEEMREEGGTPSIIGSIRVGLAIQLKEAVGTEWIMSREEELCRRVFREWESVEELIVVGPHSIPRLPVFSFLIRHPLTGRFLHHNFVCILLNDLFGIQARGGCSCAGPYAQNLLGISEEMAKRYESLVMEDSRLDRVHLRRYHEYSEREALRPGVTRLGFPYFMSDDAVNYVIDSVTMVAKYGWKLLPQYVLDPESGLFRHSNFHPSKERKWLSSISYESGEMTHPLSTTTPLSAAMSYKSMLADAQKVFDEMSSSSKLLPAPIDQTSYLGEEAESMRWFLLPSEAQRALSGQTTPTSTPPFQPRHFPGAPQLLKDDKPRDKTTSLQRNKEEVKEHFTTKVEEERELVRDQLEDIEVKKTEKVVKFHSPTKVIYKPTTEAIDEFKMIKDGDRILVCISGGKDSLSLLHTLKQYQFAAKSKGVKFELGAVTVDPQTPSYNPRPLISYMSSLGVPYFYEEQGILQQAISLPECASICSFCSRMKRGRLYSCARREGYNVLAMGQHLDDLAESFLMSAFHNGFIRTMKANYTVKEGDLRVIRPFVYVREKDLRHFADSCPLPVIAENCPACFEAPKERHRMKQLLAAQELLFPKLFASLQAAMRPLMARSRTGMEGGRTSRLLNQTGLDFDDDDDDA